MVPTNLHTSVPIEDEETASLTKLPPSDTVHGPINDVPRSQGGVTALCEGTRWRLYLAIALTLCAMLMLGGVLTAVSLDGHGSDDYTYRYLVVGDWGRNGLYNQSEVAKAMGRTGNNLDFVISVGDNFYESGLTSVEDAQFDTSFTHIYTAESLQVPWHVVLGNHDMGEYWPLNTSEHTMPQPTNCPANASNDECFYGPLHQLDVRLRERDSRWHCERSWTMTLADGAVDFFFIDTSPMVQEYHQVVWASNRGGILEQSPDAQLKELEVRLARSTADWKIVVGHHPILSDLHEFPEVGAALKPLMDTYGVDAYLCGHEHNLQHLHIETERTHYIVSGGGSQSNAYGFVDEERPELRLFHPGSGFVECILTPEQLRVHYYSIMHKDPIYSFAIANDS
ncbi:g10320 [Coccomyxa elongata]